MNYWRVKLYDGDDLLVTPGEAEGFKEMVLQKKTHISYKGSLIAAKNISVIEETTDAMPSETKRITAGTLATGPILNERGELKWHWAKKQVSGREWNSYYSQHPSYRLLKRTDNGAWVAFKMLAHLLAGDGVEPLSADELPLIKRSALD